MDTLDRLFGGFETHSPNEIRAAIDEGADPIGPVRGKTPIDRLVEMYTRSVRFAECLRVMLDAGATLDDPFLEALLLDDTGRLSEILKASPSAFERILSLDCAYTSLREVTALHVCAEYNCTNCARVLLNAGLDVNARAGIDKHGLGGHTPLFHTVNSNRNHCRPMMELLVGAGADIDIRVDALLWGAGCDWETTVFDITPISYAQCGLYPQFHRREQDVYANIDFLYRRRCGISPHLRNVPNKYVDKDFNLGAARGGQDAEQADRDR